MYVDFGDFPPQDIVAAFIAAEKQEMVFANLLREPQVGGWRELVELAGEGRIRRGRTGRSPELLALQAAGRTEMMSASGAIKNNLLSPIRRLHRPGATLGKNIIEELKQNSNT